MRHISIVLAFVFIPLGCEQDDNSAERPSAEELAAAQAECPPEWASLYNIEKLQDEAVAITQEVIDYQTSSESTVELVIPDTTEGIPSACEPLKEAYEIMEMENTAVEQQLSAAKALDPKILGIFSAPKCIVVEVPPGATAKPPRGCVEYNYENYELDDLYCDFENIYPFDPPSECEDGYVNTGSSTDYVAWTVMPNEK